MVGEGGRGPNKPRLVRGGAKNNEMNAGDANDADVTHQFENASLTRLNSDANTRKRDNVVDLGNLLAMNRTEGDNKIMLGESGILLPAGKIYAMFDVSEDLAIGCLGGPLLPKWIASTMEKVHPGRAVGYLPDNPEFLPYATIHEYLNFLGRLHKMSSGLILQRIRALSESLQLPLERSRFIDIPLKDLRRVDLAAALIHSPSLLIIAELPWKQDASSREKIRSYLKTLTRDDDVAVVLLTADPEEADHADIVGFFDHGRLIAEDSPDRLLQEFQCGTLEEVFRKLRDGQLWKVVRHSESGEAVIEKAPFCKASHGTEFTSAPVAVTCGSIGLTEQLKMLLDSWRRILLLLAYKNNLLKVHYYKSFRRATWLTLIVHSICYAVCLSVVTERLAVVRSDGNSTFAESLLHSLPGDRIHQRPYSNRHEALASMKRGETSAVMEIGSNFSTAPHHRLQCTFSTDDNETSRNSTLDIELETIDQGTRFVLLQMIFMDVLEVLGYHILNSITAHSKFRGKASLRNVVILRNLLTDGINEFRRSLRPFSNDFRRNVVKENNASHAQITLEISDPVFGSRFISRFEFLAPRLLIQVPFVMMMLHTASHICVEYSFINTRLALAGVKPFEIIISTLLSLLYVLVLHAAGLVVCIFLLYWGSLLPLEGPLTLVIRLILEQGLQGMAVGLTIESLSLPVRAKTMLKLLVQVLIDVSIHLSAATFMYVALLPYTFRLDIIRSIQYYLLPTTYTESLFYIMFRGWGLEKKEVAIGFTGLGQCTGFFPIFVTFCLLGFIVCMYNELLYRVFRKPARLCQGRTIGLPPKSTSVAQMSRGSLP